MPSAVSSRDASLPYTPYEPEEDVCRDAPVLADDSVAAMLETSARPAHQRDPPIRTIIKMPITSRSPPAQERSSVPTFRLPWTVTGISTWGSAPGSA
jgi:hypothetical protein